MLKLLVHVQGHQKAFKLQVDLCQDGRSVQFFGLNQPDRSYFNIKRIDVVGLNHQSTESFTAEGEESDGISYALRKPDLSEF